MTEDSLSAIVPAELSTQLPLPARDPRIAVGFGAALRRQGMMRKPVKLVDLSAHGFCTEVDDPLPVGTMLWLTLPGLAPLQARLAWRRGFRVGCQFSVPLHPSVLQSIVSRQG